MSERTRPSRRTVMKAFGQYLDWLEWFNNVKRGTEEPPEGDTIADMAMSAARLEDDYRDLVTEYINAAHTDT